MSMLKYGLIGLLILTSPLIQALEPITPADAPIVVYRVESGYEEVKEFLKLAITDRGMKISSILHISDMLERTAEDTGLDQTLYAKAESVEFCSVLMSYRMSQAHPANMAVCPLTIGVYALPGEEEISYLSYQRPYLLGDGEQAAAELVELLDGIVRSAIE